MTEEEWLTCIDPEPMLDRLIAKTSSRKLRLFACACCRRVQHLLREEWELRALELAQRMADGAKKEKWFEEVQKTEVGPGMSPASNAVASAVIWWNKGLAVRDVAERAAYAVDGNAMFAPGFVSKERGAQAELLREIVGNPFRRITLNREWLSVPVIGLAESIYVENAWTRVSSLAGALEGAGCSNIAMLAHARESRVHLRGCWLVDLLTARK